MTKWFLTITGLLVLVLWGAFHFFRPESGGVRQSGLFRQEAYVWQRVWTPAVVDSVRAHGTHLAGLVALAAEVSWKRGKPELMKPGIDFAALRSVGCAVGLALRIGPFAGPFRADDERARWLAGVAESLLVEARSNRVEVVELQVDFDCAESRLAGYRAWIEAIRGRVAPTPVVFTALPAWLNRRDFTALARAADGFVLQVHSLERPTRPDALFVLCDPVRARAWVERAARCGVPFRVALPTYGYLVAFDRSGQFVGLAAETASFDWPAGSQLREVRSEGAAMAGLVEGWIRDRPGVMQGVIWYRLPVSGDARNWSWTTLASVMEGRVPRPRLRADLARPQAALVEVRVENEGSADATGPVGITLRWPAGRLVAGDGLGGFELIERGPKAAELRAAGLRLVPGGSSAAGWLRFESETDVAVEVAVH